MPRLAILLAFVLGIELLILFTDEAHQPIDLPEIRFDQADAVNRQKLQLMYQDAVNQYRRHASHRSLVRLADLLLCYGYHYQASLLYRAVLLQDPEQMRSWQGLAMAYDSLGQLQPAIRCYQRLQTSDFGAEARAQFQHRTGELHLINGDAHSAREIFSGNRAHAPSRYRLIRLLLHAGEMTAAHEHMTKLVAHPDAATAIECEQLNDLSLRLHNKILLTLPPHKRSSELSYQPIDIFKRSLESYYGMSVMELYTPALREMPQMMAQIGQLNDAQFWELLQQDAVLKRGREVFASHNCAVCHGPQGYGNTAPNLRDHYWLSENSPTGIFETITYGRRSSTMPGHQFSLRPDQIRDVTVYIMHINLTTEKEDGRTATGKEPQGKLLPLERHRP